MRLYIIITLIFSLCGCKGEIKNHYSGPSFKINEKIEQKDEAIVNEVASQQKSPSAEYRIIPLYGDKIKLSIPKDFTLMSNEMKRRKYPVGNNPDFVFTNNEGTVNIAFNHTPVTVRNNDVVSFENTFLQQLQNSNPINMTHRVELINEAEFVVFEFTSQAVDTKVYNLLFLTNLDGKLLLGTFNCTDDLKKDWEPKMKGMLLSIKK